MLMGADRFHILNNLQVIGAGRRAARCPICASTDKERLMYAFLNYMERLNLKTNKTYGYGYHERIYNNEDYKELLMSVGFQVGVCNISDRFNTMGLNSQEDFYVCRKVDL